MYDCEEVMPPENRRESLSPLLVQVNRALKQRDEAVRLCGEILATLGLPQNRESIEKLILGGYIDAAPIENFEKMLAVWNRQFAGCSGKPEPLSPLRYPRCWLVWLA